MLSSANLSGATLTNARPVFLDAQQRQLERGGRHGGILL